MVIFGFIVVMIMTIALIVLAMYAFLLDVLLERARRACGGKTLFKGEATGALTLGGVAAALGLITLLAGAVVMQADPKSVGMWTVIGLTAGAIATLAVCAVWSVGYRHLRDDCQRALDAHEMDDIVYVEDYDKAVKQQIPA